MSKPPTILISGMMAGVPYQGGASWAVLQYLLGFRRLGFRVFFLEPIRAEMIRPPGSSLGESLSASYFRRLSEAWGLAESAGLIQFDRMRSVGLRLPRIRQILEESDVLINLAGTLPLHAAGAGIPVRIYLDLDPAFTQMWQSEGEDMRLNGHTHYFTVGLSLSRPGCPIPTLGLDWRTTVQPVVLDLWPPQRGHGSAFTTVANWRSYGPVVFQGRRYGQKAHAWRPLMELPRRSGSVFRVALAIDPSEKEDLEQLGRHGWQLADPREVAGTPGRYREFIQHSRAELAVAKSGYVDSRSGWFSERSACYLASGRPVVAQATGFEDHLPCGEGLLSFGTLEEAVNAVREVEGRYRRHAESARAVAEDYFDSRRVLPRLLRSAGAL